MKRILFFVAAMAVTMSSCSKNEVITSTMDNQAISFGAYAGVSTKGSVTELANGFSMGVFGYYTNETAWAGSTETPNFMYNQTVNYTKTTDDWGLMTETWAYSPIKYWPNENDDKISFFAYSPQDATDDCMTISTAAVTGTPTVTFDYTSYDLSKSVDFVAGSAINLTQANNGSGVAFTLKHELTRVALSLQLAEAFGEKEPTTVVVKSIKFSGAKVYNKATYKFGNKTTDVGTWDYTAAASNTSFEMISYMKGYNNAVKLGVKEDYINSGLLLTTKTAETLGENEYLFLLPAYAAGTIEGAAGDVSLTIVYDVVTADASLPNGSYSAIENTKTFSLTTSAAPALVQGKAYSYNATISLTEVSLKASVSNDWGTTTSENLTITADSSTASN